MAVLSSLKNSLPKEKIGKIIPIFCKKRKDWQRVTTHEQYKQELHWAHGRTYSFWNKYRDNPEKAQ
jgi:hypothetical protein